MSLNLRCWCKLLYNNSQALLSKHQSIDCQDSVTSNMYMQQWPNPVDSYPLRQLKSQPHIRRDTERPSGLLEDRLLRGCMCAAAERIKSAGQFHSNHVLHFSSAVSRHEQRKLLSTPLFREDGQRLAFTLLLLSWVSVTPFPIPWGPLPYKYTQAYNRLSICLVRANLSCRAQKASQEADQGKTGLRTVS